jgi:hypothetical protein
MWIHRGRTDVSVMADKHISIAVLYKYIVYYYYYSLSIVIRQPVCNGEQRKVIKFKGINKNIIEVSQNYGSMEHYNYCRVSCYFVAS